MKVSWMMMVTKRGKRMKKEMNKRVA